MASPPYMSIWVADWTADTQHLSCEQDGAYWRLVRAMWRAHGYLPNDERKLAHIAGLSIKKWRSISPDVLDFFDTQGDHLVHARLHKTLESVSATSAERVAAGARGGRAKALNNKKRDVANATILPEQTASISDVKYHIAAADAREDDWPDGKPLDHARLLSDASETPNLSIDRSPGLAQGIGALHRWKRDGASWEHDVVPVVTALARKARSPIKSWSYFEDAITQSIAENRRAMTIPEHDDVQRSHPQRPDNGHDSRKLGALAFLAEREDQ